jgi:hypothetical protein
MNENIKWKTISLLLMEWNGIFNRIEKKMKIIIEWLYSAFFSPFFFDD